MRKKLRKRGLKKELKRLKVIFSNLSMDVIQNKILPFYQIDVKKLDDIEIRNLYIQMAEEFEGGYKIYYYPIFTSFRLIQSTLNRFNKKIVIRNFVNSVTKSIHNLETDEFFQETDYSYGFINFSKLKHITIDRQSKRSYIFYEFLAPLQLLPQLKTIKLLNGSSSDTQLIEDMTLNFPYLEKITISRCSFYREKFFKTLKSFQNKNIYIVFYLNQDNEKDNKIKMTIKNFIIKFKKYFKNANILTFGPYFYNYYKREEEGRLYEIRQYYIEVEGMKSPPPTTGHGGFSFGE